MKRLIVQVNAIIFFGKDLASDPQFTEALLTFPEEVYTTAELLRVTPSILAP
jgi:hypothetical protein